MRKVFILLLIAAGFIFNGCKEVEDSERFYLEGIKAEHNMDYDKAIGLYAKSLQYNREDPITWYAKGRCHLLLTMQTALVDSADSQREIKLMGNLSKAGDCFKRSRQWGYRPSSEVDSLKIWLNRRLH